ncbi:hypothetical protein O0L34_g3232 [Tuta absoluta]|nr:hypothetical protein O0L34_g3232 [Tuta absoluta]
MKLKKVKFALTFDEWTSINNHRYININIHSKSFKNGKMFHNLGLIRIQGNMPAEVCISLIQARLAAYDLTLSDCDNDVVAMTTDGASVMSRVGRLLPIFHQLCLAHGIHLAICDVLYKKDHHHFSSESASDLRAENVENEVSSDDDEDFASDGEFVVERAGSSYSLNLDFQGIVKKVRTVVKLFKKSPTKNDTILQKHVQDEFQKELALLLDCKTRWSSMATMLERFLKLRMCVQKALIDLKSDISFTSAEIQLIQDLQLSLEIVKDTEEALCRRDATLITANTALRLMIKSLDEKEGSRRIFGTLKDRMKERRLHNVTGTLLYLHNHEVFCKLPADDGVFIKPSNEEIEEIICKTVQIEGMGLGVSEAESSASTSLISRELELIESQQLSFREKLDLELNNKQGWRRCSAKTVARN